MGEEQSRQRAAKTKNPEAGISFFGKENLKPGIVSAVGARLRVTCSAGAWPL